MVLPTLIVIVLSIVSLSAWAGDGRIEINQTCAVQTGCVPGDTPGFPVTLSTGSYVLTGNLNVTSDATNAIFINGEHIWLDLGGFEILGPNTCTSPGPVCTSSNFVAGIVSAPVGYATVLNGTVRGFGGNGVTLREHARVENVLVSENGGGGLVCNDASLVRRVRSVRNMGIGISGVLQLTTEGKAVVLLDNLVDGNGAQGIIAGEGSVVAGNLSDGNAGTGIDAFAGGHAIHDNRVRRNGGNGIRASAGAIVEGNTVTENAGMGLFLNNAAGYAFNVIRTDPSVAGSVTVNAGPQNLGNNLCNGSTTCP